MIRRDVRDMMYGIEGLRDKRRNIRLNEKVNLKIMVGALIENPKTFMV